MITRPIYLDYNATTPVDSRVLESLLPYLVDEFGNPSSAHEYGRAAARAVAAAREQVAGLVGAGSGEIIFTGGGSEASNLAIKGVVWPRLFERHPPLPRGGREGDGPRIITSAIEHPATVTTCRALEAMGCQVETLPVDGLGVVSLGALREALQRPAALVTIMHSNNEVGTLQPIGEIARLAHQAGALVHCDAAQSIGKLPIDVRELAVDMLSIAGHKFYAPKGIGALYVREGVELEPLIHGAGHERGRRAGTENVPYIVGLGRAAEIARTTLPEATTRLRTLRDRLWRKLHDGLGGRVVLNGHPDLRLPNTLNVSFQGWIGSDLLAATPEVAASTGSACHEGSVRLSPVLAAMGVDPQRGAGAVRLSVGRFSTEQEIDHAAELLIKTALGPSTSNKAPG